VTSTARSGSGAPDGACRRSRPHRIEADNTAYDSAAFRKRLVGRNPLPVIPVGEIARRPTAARMPTVAWTTRGKS
jgi:hypothetical protein